MAELAGPYRVALTGGIASGKTAVASEFEKLGITVIDTDRIARDVVEPGTPTLARITADFGDDLVNASGQLDRRRLRELIFADAAKRQRLDDITHPAIGAELERRAATVVGPYQIHAIPLLAEGGRAGSYKRVLVVDCPEELQIARLMQRDSVDEAQARRALASQSNRQRRLAIADDVIENTGSLEQLRTRVQELHRQYLNLAAQK